METVRLTKETIPDIALLQFNNEITIKYGFHHFMWLDGKAHELPEWNFVNNTPVSHTSMPLDFKGNTLLIFCWFQTLKLSHALRLAGLKIWWLAKNFSLRLKLALPSEGVS